MDFLNALANRIYIDATAGGRQRFKPLAQAQAHLDYPPIVATLNLKECDGDLQQPLVKRARRRLVLDPRMFQRFVSLEVLALIMKFDAFQSQLR